MNRVLPIDAHPPSALERLVEHAWFKRPIIALIVLSTVLLGFETLRGLPVSTAEWLFRINRIILGVFVVELALRIAAHRRAFFRDPWSLFDLTIVAAALVLPGNTAQVLRALRILRALRLVSAVPSLRRVVDGLLGAVPGIASITVLLVLLLYVAAVMATLLFRDVSPEHFGHLGVSLFTLFQIMTLEGWPDIARNVMASEPWAWVFFAGYILVATYMVLNLVIGVVVSSIQSRMDAEQPASASETKLAHDVAELRREIAALHAEISRRRD
jgi:voltage-gated sodium channel